MRALDTIDRYFAQTPQLGRREVVSDQNSGRG